MSSFHSYFKSECASLHLADGTFTTRGLSLSVYLDMAKRLNSHLTLHHTIEERHIFPVLAKRMPQFSTETDDAHINSHKQIHKGLDELATLVSKFKNEPSTYCNQLAPTEMRACLDSFREVLFTHLDEEVNDLGAENMKKYWKLEELATIPM
ncbi:hemerythrin/HHE cation-binding motif-containing protein [Mycena galericulata]|nr:hemerythrin/HHE cation-binding motif-containing protein [Mycena galericulata]